MSHAGGHAGGVSGIKSRGRVSYARAYGARGWGQVEANEAFGSTIPYYQAGCRRFTCSVISSGKPITLSRPWRETFILSQSK